MKKVLSFLCFLSQSFICFSQLEASFKKDNDTLTYSRLKAVDQIIHIPVTISGINTNSTANTVSFIINPAQSAAGVFAFNSSPLIVTVNTNTSQIDCPVTVLKGENPGSSPFFVDVQMSYNNGTITKNKNITVKVTDGAKTEEEADEASFFSRITFLNAYNFDFNSKLSSNYVGKFNVYQPNNRIWHWGVNTGIMKINYGVDDSIAKDSYRTENILIHPLDTFKAGEKYLRQFNKYASKVRNTAWSFYLQPLLRINKSEKTKLYFHGHLELLVNKFSVTTTITNIQQDTAIFLETANRLGRPRPAVEKEITAVNTLLNGYFGFGATFDISLAKKSSLFIQGTVGGTTNYPQPASAPNSNGSSTDVYSRVRAYDTWNKFYLVRVYYNQTVSDAAKIVIATDIRGLFPKYNPLYAIYLGLNLKLESLIETITGKK